MIACPLSAFTNHITPVLLWVLLPSNRLPPGFSFWLKHTHMRPAGRAHHINTDLLCFLFAACDRLRCDIYFIPALDSLSELSCDCSLVIWWFIFIYQALYFVCLRWEHCCRCTVSHGTQCISLAGSPDDKKLTHGLEQELKQAEKRKGTRQQIAALVSYSSFLSASVCLNETFTELLWTLIHRSGPHFNPEATGYGL